MTEPLIPGAMTPDGQPFTLQAQLTERLQQAILTGLLPAGTVLVSSRSLASELGISRNTVVNVYEHLAAEGYILADRRGTRVASLSGPPHSTTSLPNRATTPVVLASRIKLYLDNPFQTATNALLSPGIPALRDFPFTPWRKHLDSASRMLSPSSLDHGEATGEPALREAIATHLHVARGVRCDVSQIVITEGARQALELCVTLLTDSDDTVWMEEPGYRGAQAAFSAGNLKTIQMPVDEEGIHVADNAWSACTPKLIYTTPAHQYPSGAVLSVARRLELIKKATESGSWLIEDDYDGDFRHSGGGIASMQGLVSDAPVLYIGSFSKTLFPALRLGFVVFPSAIIQQARTALNEILRSGNRTQQIALAGFMKSNEFARHLGRMRRLYRERQQVLRDALAAFLPQEQIVGGKAGLHLTLKFSSPIDDIKVAELARQHSIGVHALSTYFLHPETAEKGLVIGYGNTSSQEIWKAVNLLAQIAAQIRSAQKEPQPLSQRDC